MKQIITMKIFFSVIYIFIFSFSYAQQTDTIKHTVVSGNTLFSISKEYGISVADIKHWNNLTSFSLKAGQQLAVGFKAVTKNNTIVKTESIVNEKPKEIEPIKPSSQTTIIEKPTAVKELKAETQTIEELGFKVSEINNATINSNLLPVKSDTAKSNLIFCGGVEDDKPVGISSVFFNNRGQNYVYVFIEKDTSFNFKNFNVDLFSVNEKNEKNKLSSTVYDVKPRWKYTMFKYFIDQPGLYEIVVLDDKKKKMGDGQVRILP